MIDVNEYFEGNVKSLSLNSPEGRKTVGVIAPGEYDFNTETKESMTIIVGEVSVYLPEYDEWEDFGKGSSFDVPAKSSFKVKAEADAAYVCEYE